MMRKKDSSFIHRDLWPLLLLVGMIVWFSGGMVWDGKIPFFRDLGPYFYPMRLSLAESFRSGELPLWDRHMGAGFPLLADFQTGAFYPPHLAFLVLPFFSAVSIIFLFHYLIAATGSYLLCRRWEYPPYLSMLGAILFTFGGVIVSLMNLLNHFQAAVWLPWVILFAERCLCSSRSREFIGFVVVLLMQLFAGSPEFYGMSALLVIFACLRLKAIGPEIVSYRKILLVLIGGNTLVFALAMIQLAPTIELFLHSRRSQPLPFSEAIDWSLNPYDLFNLFFLDKELDTTILPGMRLFFMSRASFFVSYYLGAASLFGVWFWMLSSSVKEIAVTLVLIVLTLLFAFGGYTPVYPFVLDSFPVVGLVRFPEKFFFLTFGLLWFVILRGFFLFFEAHAHLQKRGFAVLFSIIFVFLVFYLFLRLNTDFVSQFVAFRTNSLLLSNPTVERTASVLVSIERQLFLSLGLLILFFAAKKRLARVALIQLLLVTATFIDLERAHREYQYLLDPSFVYKVQTVVSESGPNVGRVFYYPVGETLHPAHYSVLARPSFEEAISLVFANLLPNTGMFRGFEYFQEIDAFSRRPYLTFLTFADRVDPERRFRLLGALNVKYLISFRPLPEKGITLIRHFAEYPSWLYKIEKPVPRVYVASKPKAEKSTLKILNEISGDAFDPLKEVLLDETVSIIAKDNFQSRTEILTYSNRSVVVRASLNGSGVLVLTDSFYPGWKVYVNGVEKKILRANYFFRGVLLASGEHFVEFRYQPNSFMYGCIVSLFTITGLITATFLRYWLKRRRVFFTSGSQS